MHGMLDSAIFPAMSLGGNVNEGAQAKSASVLLYLIH
jgi:hypothetical protein